MSTLPWLPVIELSVIALGVILASWLAIDRRRWWLIRAYRKHRVDIDARRHIEWAQALARKEKW